MSSYSCRDGCYQKTQDKCWQGCGEKATLLHCWWECKMVVEVAEQKGVLLCGRSRHWGVANTGDNCLRKWVLFLSDVECARTFLTSRILFLFSPSGIFFPQLLLWLAIFSPLHLKSLITFPKGICSFKILLLCISSLCSTNNYLTLLNNWCVAVFPQEWEWGLVSVLHCHVPSF